MSSMLTKIVAITTVAVMTCIAQAQVVIDMPAPKRQSDLVAGVVQPSASTSFDEPFEVSVGEVALYRYSSTRFTPRSVGPRFFEQYTRWDYPPYHIGGWWGFPIIGPAITFRHGPRRFRPPHFHHKHH